MSGCSESSRRTEREGGEESGELESRRPVKENQCGCVHKEGWRSVRGTMVQPGCSDPGKAELLPGPGLHARYLSSTHTSACAAFTARVREREI